MSNEQTQFQFLNKTKKIIKFMELIKFNFILVCVELLIIWMVII